MQQNNAFQLVDYGIFSEVSDFRVHVCPIAKRLYVYPTQNATDLLLNAVKHYPKVNGKTQEQITSEGYLVPPEDIPACFCILPKADLWAVAPIHARMTATQKGEAALKIVKAAAERGLLPIKMKVEIITDFDEQIEGVDVRVKGEACLQVKCDFAGGDKAAGGSGNLFLQIAEANPLKQH